MEEGKIKNKKVRFLVDVAVWVVIFALVFGGIKLVHLMLPLVIGFVFAALSRPLAKWMSAETKKLRAKDGTVTEVPRKVKLNKKVATVLSVVILLLVLAGIIFLFVFKLPEFYVVCRVSAEFYRTFFSGNQQGFFKVLRIDI